MAKSVGSIAPDEYRQWVQRSLNRMLETELVVDGSDSIAYRQAVERFNKMFVKKPVDDKVDQNTQDELIKHNEQDSKYMRWVEEGLNITGAELLASGKKTDKTKTAIQTFQAFHGLHDDGFVGAKTELALINELAALKITGHFPPGHIEPKKTKPEPTTERKEPFFRSGPVIKQLPNWMSQDAKDWAGKPVKTVEVRRFKGNRRFWGDVIVWKNARGLVDAYLERPTDVTYIRDNLSNKQKDLAEKVRSVNQQYNADMSFYVEEKKLSPTEAEKKYREQWGDILYGLVSGLTTF